MRYNAYGNSKLPCHRVLKVFRLLQCVQKHRHGQILTRLTQQSRHVVPKERIDLQYLGQRM